MKQLKGEGVREEVGCRFAAASFCKAKQFDLSFLFMILKTRNTTAFFYGFFSEWSVLLQFSWFTPFLEVKIPYEPLCPFVDWFVGRSFILSLKRSEVTLPCTYRSLNDI